MQGMEKNKFWSGISSNFKNGAMSNTSTGRVVTSRGTPKSPKAMNKWSMSSIARPMNRTSVAEGSVDAKKMC